LLINLSNFAFRFKKVIFNSQKLLKPNFNQMQKILKPLLIFIFFLSSNVALAGMCSQVCGPCDNYMCGRVSSNKKMLMHVKFSDKSLLNLKSTAEKSVSATNSAITITESDFQSIAQNGNSWIDFKSFNSSFTMDIGTANTSSPQTFTLPSNLLNNFINYSRLDFVNESSLDVGLQISGADVAARKLLVDNNDNAVYQYIHVDISSGGVFVLGTSYDLYDETDDNFDEEADYEFLDAPLALNDVVTSVVEEIDYETDVSLLQEKEIKTVNGYGTLVLPNGSSVACLRMGIVREKRTRANVNDPFPTNPESTVNAIAFLTKEGHYFMGDITSQSGNNATLNNLTYRFVQATNTLEETNSVRINNNSKAVSINSTDDFAHQSAILDIQSNDKGVLIPRIAKANRPASPAEGLLIYQIDNTPGFYYFDGTAWQRLDNTVSSMMRVAADETTNSENGIGELKNGVGLIKFKGNRDDFEKVLINIQLEGDCNGVYISKKTREGFEVKELQKGKSNVKFTWKID
jgi:hypothetical protein